MGKLIKYKGKFYNAQFKNGKMTKYRLATKADWKGKRTYSIFR